MAEMVYDQQTRDLARLAAQRVSDAVASVLQLCDGPDQALQVAIMATGSAMGGAAGAVSAKYGCSTEEAKRILAGLILDEPPEAVAPGDPS